MAKASEKTAQVYRVALVDGVNAAQFNVAGVEVELDAENRPVFETDRQSTFKALLAQHPFLKEA